MPINIFLYSLLGYIFAISGIVIGVYIFAQAFIKPKKNLKPYVTKNNNAEEKNNIQTEDEESTELFDMLNDIEPSECNETSEIDIESIPNEPITYSDIYSHCQEGEESIVMGNKRKTEDDSYNIIRRKLEE